MPAPVGDCGGWRVRMSPGEPWCVLAQVRGVFVGTTTISLALLTCCGDAPRLRVAGRGEGELRLRSAETDTELCGECRAVAGGEVVA